MAIDWSKMNEAELGEAIAGAQARLVELQSEKIARVRDQVLAMITSEGLDYGELMGHIAGARAKAKTGSGPARAKAKPKYRNPADKSQEWSGRGRQPRWFADAIAAGKSERSLLIP